MNFFRWTNSKAVVEEFVIFFIWKCPDFDSPVEKENMARSVEPTFANKCTVGKGNVIISKLIKD